jgi:hypothetical protein
MNCGRDTIGSLPCFCVFSSFSCIDYGVGVGGTGVAVGGTGVAVGGTGVAVGGTGVAVGGTGVAVGCVFGVGVTPGVIPGTPLL